MNRSEARRPLGLDACVAALLKRQRWVHHFAPVAQVMHPADSDSLVNRGTTDSLTAARLQWARAVQAASLFTPSTQAPAQHMAQSKQQRQQQAWTPPSATAQHALQPGMQYQPPMSQVMQGNAGAINVREAERVGCAVKQGPKL